MKINLTTPTDEQFEKICIHIQELQLDNRNLQKEEFVVATDDNQIAGFGRLRKYIDCEEICSVGVLPAYRGKHIGKAIVEKLIQLSSNNLFVVCIIPNYFRQLGFNITENYPQSITQKLNYCRGSLPVPEIYVAMVLEKQ